MAFFQWLFNQGATVIVPFVVIILGLIFRAPLKKTLVCALRMGVGFTALNALIGLVLGQLGEAGAIMGTRYGIGLSVPDVGWATFSAITFAAPFAMAAIAAFIIANAVLVVIGFTKTLNIDFFNHWIFVFTILAVYVGTNNWYLGIASGVIYWLLTLKLADWTAPYIEPYYGMAGISIPHVHSVTYAPFGFFMDKVWDRIPVIKDIKWDSETLQEKFGVFGQPVVLGFLVGLIFGGFAYLGSDAVSGLGNQIGKMLSLGFTVSFFMVLLPRAAELIVLGLAPLSESVRKFIVKKMPGREFYIGLDAAVLVGKAEHIALGAMLAPIVYLIAIIIPGNEVLPLADAAGYMIFFTVFAVNTCNGNIFRGLLNSIIIWIPLALILSNQNLPLNTEIANYVGFALPEGVSQLASLTTGSNFFTYIFVELSRFITGVGSVSAVCWSLALLIAWVVAFYIVRNRPKEYAKELRGETNEQSA